MKKYLLILTLTMSTSLFANELHWVDTQVEAIKPPRKGMQTQELAGIKDPFVFLVKKEDKKYRVLLQTVQSHRCNRSRKLQNHSYCRWW